MKVLVTGVAGFIGVALAQRLLDRGDEVVGIDKLNDYYDAHVKVARFERLRERPKFAFRTLDIAGRRPTGRRRNSSSPAGLTRWRT